MENITFKGIMEFSVAIAVFIHAAIYLGRFIRWIRHRRPKPQGPKPATYPGGTDYLLGIVYSLLCAVLWSASYVSLSYVSQKADFMEINITLLGSAAVFLVAGASLRRWWTHESMAVTVPSMSWTTWQLCLIAAANTLSFVLFVYALWFISASQTITLNKINPIFVALLSWLWLKQLPPRSTFSAVFLVVMGTLLITADDQFSFRLGPELTGSLLALGAGLCFAVFSIGLEQVEQKETTLTSRLAFLAAVFFLSYISMVTLAYALRTPPAGDLGSSAILVLNGLRVALVYALYHAAIRRIGALRTSILVALEVPLTMVWDLEFLDRPPTSRLIVGALAILFAAVTLGWDMLRSSKAPNREQAQ